MTLFFLFVRLFGAGVPITAGLKRSCSVHAGLPGKIPQALRARIIFSTNPEGLALLVRKEHGLPLPEVMGTRLRYAWLFRYGLFYTLGDYVSKFWNSQKKTLSLHLRFRLNNLFGCFDLFALTSFTVDSLTIFQLVKKEVNMVVLSIIGAVGFVQELQVSD